MRFHQHKLARLLTLAWSAFSISASAASLSYSTLQFNESGDNLGDIGNPITITAQGVSFSSGYSAFSGTEDWVQSGKILVYNVPAGLSASAVLNSSGALVLSLSGNALHNASTDSINNMSVSFTNAAFYNTLASSVASSNQNLSINFIDNTALPLVTSATATGVGGKQSSDTSESFSLTLNEGTSAYYVVLPASASAPTGAQVGDHTDANGNAALHTGTVSSYGLSNPLAAYPTISGLSPGTSYAAYFVAGNPVLFSTQPINVQTTPVVAYFTTTGTSASANSQLASLQVNQGQLVPSFSSSTYAYAESVDNGVSSMSLTPTVFSNLSTVRINGTLVNSINQQVTVPLQVGTNLITIESATDSGISTYTINVLRAAPLDTGRNDILFENGSTGQIDMMQVMGPSILHNGTVFTETDPAWKLVGNGDFYGDGKRELLWRNDVTGTISMMNIVAGAVTSNTVVATEPDLNWHIVGTGDYNGDGRADILWQNISNGQVYMTPMNGAAIQSIQFVTQLANTNWQVVASGDYDGDGKSDILLHNNSTGAVEMLLMNGTTIKARQTIVPASDTSWQVAASGDFDGDGHSDILAWNSVTGQTYMILMNGFTIVNSQFT